MRTASLPLLACFLGLTATAALAQEPPPAPPTNAIPLSQIVGEVEKRDGFQYIDNVDWDEDGYVVIYFTNDRAKVEIKYDAATGKPK